MKNLTLKRLLKRHKENPQDADLHKVIETVDIDQKDFHDIVKKGTEQEAFDKKKD